LNVLLKQRRNLVYPKETATGKGKLEKVWGG